MEKYQFIFTCHLGGKFETTNDGSLNYVGGDAQAINIGMCEYLSFDTFREPIASMFNCRADSISGFKYFLLHQKRTLITISNDTGLRVRCAKLMGELTWNYGWLIKFTRI
ncbi:hypothetical protein M5689_008624 [Euphorbia peplus]|nr:hypothetical protein M5689_008624 [Euphorbia peplus]